MRVKRCVCNSSCVAVAKLKQCKNARIVFGLSNGMTEDMSAIWFSLCTHVCVSVSVLFASQWNLAFIFWSTNMYNKQRRHLLNEQMVFLISISTWNTIFPLQTQTNTKVAIFRRKNEIINKEESHTHTHTRLSYLAFCVFWFWKLPIKWA